MDSVPAPFLQAVTVILVGVVAFFLKETWREIKEFRDEYEDHKVAITNRVTALETKAGFQRRNNDTA